MHVRKSRAVLDVRYRQCSECLYSARKVVSDARRDAIVAHCARTEQGFSCHKATDAGVDVMCRAHWERTKDATVRNRLAQQLGVVRFVNDHGEAV